MQTTRMDRKILRLPGTATFDNGSKTIDGTASGNSGKITIDRIDLK